MLTTTTTEEESRRADEIWAEYQREHDVSALKGKTAGIDPRSGRLWFGESIPDVARQLEAEGVDTPLFFVRVGYDYYYRKGGRRLSRVAVSYGAQTVSETDLRCKHNH